LRLGQVSRGGTSQCGHEPCLHHDQSGCLVEPASMVADFQGAQQKDASTVLSWSLVTIWLAFFCDYMLMFMAVPIFPALGKTDIMTGCLFSAKAGCHILSAPMMAKLVDGHGKLMMLVGLLLQAFSSIMFMLTDSYFTWFVARAVSGVASAAIGPSCLSHLTKLHPHTEQRAMAMALATTGTLSGICVGPLAGGVLYDVAPSLPFLCIALLQLLVVLLVLSCLPSLKAEATSTEGTGASTCELLQNHDVLRTLGLFWFSAAGAAAVETTIGRHLHNSFGYTPGAQGCFFLTESLTCITAAAASGYLGNKFGRVNLIRFGLLSQGIATWLGASASISTSAIAFAGIGLGTGLVDGGIPAQLSDTALKHFGQTGRIFVVSSTCVQLGVLCGPIAGNMMCASYNYGALCKCTSIVMLAYCGAVMRGVGD